MTEVRSTDAPSGEARMWRDIHVFHLDGESIAEHTVYRSGTWDGATITRHAVEAPLVRW